MNATLKGSVFAVTGLIAGIVGTLFFLPMNPASSTMGDDAAVAAVEEKPLYWVAPMDPNYKRDKPGKSPMGMDLIPVYDNSNAMAEAGPGTVMISPEVVNNLGVRTAPVERRSLQTEIRTVGYVQYNQDTLIHIHPRVEGWIEKLYIKAAGDPVVKDRPLYDIYSPALVNAQEEYVLALDRNNQRLIQASADRLRALHLSAGAIQTLKDSRKVKQTITVFAPQSGVADNLNIREGFFVNPGTTLMSIGSLDEVWVEAEVFERQAAMVTLGTAVTMTLDYLPEQQWQGAVDYIYPTLDEETRTIKVRMRFGNELRQLKPNMFAQVTMHSSTDNDVLLVPRASVIRSGVMDRVVLALGGGRFKSVAIRMGRSDDDFIEILSGVSAGDMVVTSAHFLLDSESSKTSDFKRMHDGSQNSSASIHPMEHAQ